MFARQSCVKLYKAAAKPRKVQQSAAKLSQSCTKLGLSNEKLSQVQQSCRKAVMLLFSLHKVGERGSSIEEYGLIRYGF